MSKDIVLIINYQNNYTPTSLMGIKYQNWKSCCCSVTKSCPTLCDPMDYSMPGFPVLHYLLEFAQIRVHWVGDAIQPSCPLSPASPAFNLSQHQKDCWCSSQSGGQSIWSFSFSISPSNEYSMLISFRMDWLDLLAEPRDSQESSLAPQFKSISS